MTVPPTTHVPADPKTLHWGRLPCAATAAVAHVAPGEVFTVDTLSHEGALEDQGRDPVAFFARYGIAADAVLPDLRGAVSAVPHDPRADGPHFVTGPVCVDGARAGDLVRTRALQACVMRISETLYRVSPHPSAIIAGIKGALACLGVCDDFMAEPSQRFGAEDRRRVAALVETLRDNVTAVMTSDRQSVRPELVAPGISEGPA